MLELSTQEISVWSILIAYWCRAPNRTCSDATTTLTVYQGQINFRQGRVNKVDHGSKDKPIGVRTNSRPRQQGKLGHKKQLEVKPLDTEAKAQRLH